MDISISNIGLHSSKAARIVAQELQSTTTKRDNIPKEEDLPPEFVIEEIMTPSGERIKMKSDRLFVEEEADEEGAFSDEGVEVRGLVGSMFD